MSERLEEIQARLEKATPGPWTTAHHYDEWGKPRHWLQVLAPNIGPIAEEIDSEAGDAAFIAHAREDIPWLLSEVERLTREREEAQTGPYGIRECRGHFHVTCGEDDLRGPLMDRPTAEAAAAAENLQWANSLAKAEADLAAARERIAELEHGPYAVRECRGHFHVTCGDMDLIGGPYDRAAAEQEAAKENARWSTGKEKLEARNTALTEALQRLVDVQNGPPLIKYEKEWQAAMTAAAALLREGGP